MTPEEREVMRLLGESMLKFNKLPAEHPADIGDFTFHIHALQNIVLSREGLRVYRNESDE